MQNDPSTTNNAAPYRPNYPILPPRLGVSPLVVVLICLLLGIAVGWGWSGERAAARMAGSLDITKTNLTYVQSNQSELAALLADPRSRIIHLQPTPAVTNASAVLIWNASSGHAMLICQELWPLSSGGKYQLTAQSAQGRTSLISFIATHGVTAVQFSIPSDISFSRFDLSSGLEHEGTARTLFTALQS